MERRTNAEVLATPPPAPAVPTAALASRPGPTGPPARPAHWASSGERQPPTPAQSQLGDLRARTLDYGIDETAGMGATGNEVGVMLANASNPDPTETANEVAVELARTKAVEEAAELKKQFGSFPDREYPDLDEDQVGLWW
mgnify:CR=1 FL=1